MNQSIHVKMVPTVTNLFSGSIMADTKEQEHD